MYGGDDGSWTHVQNPFIYSLYECRYQYFIQNKTALLPQPSYFYNRIVAILVPVSTK